MLILIHLHLQGCYIASYFLSLSQEIVNDRLHLEHNSLLSYDANHGVVVLRLLWNRDSILARCLWELLWLLLQLFQAISHGDRGSSLTQPLESFLPQTSCQGWWKERPRSYNISPDQKGGSKSLTTCFTLSFTLKTLTAMYNIRCNWSISLSHGKWPAYLRSTTLEKRANMSGNMTQTLIMDRPRKVQDNKTNKDKHKLGTLKTNGFWLHFLNIEKRKVLNIMF